MKAFTELFLTLDKTTKTTEKIHTLANYFTRVSAADAAWSLYFLSGRRLKRLLPMKKFRTWALELIQIPEWLFEECYSAVGDLSEVIALLLPEHNHTANVNSLQEWIENKLLALQKSDDEKQRHIMLTAWQTLNTDERFLWNKLITGNFRVGISQSIVVKALSQISSLDETVITHRLMGDWQPSSEFYKGLLQIADGEINHARPYPFYLAYQFADALSDLGNIHDWQCEWKWDGIRAQIIKRQGQVYIWSRGEELINERFPELVAMAEHLTDGTVLDGEILPWQNGKVSNFAQLQRRIGRKNLSKRLLQEIPVIFLAFDIVEHQTKDIREVSLSQRRKILKEIIDHVPTELAVRLSPTIEVNNWEALAIAREESRRRLVEGIMLKHRHGAYLVGRRRGEWWKWKIDPLTIDAVLIAAQHGHGRRANLYTDYTFGIWSGQELVPFAKAYSGLTDEEIKQVDAFVRRHTLQRFGPVRTVKPELVFELAFEGIQHSTRHKSGFAVRFPRILRQRFDKKIEQADSITSLSNYLDSISQTISKKAN